MAIQVFTLTVRSCNLSVAVRGCILTVWQLGLYLLWQLGVVFGQNDKEGLYCDFMTIEGLYFDNEHVFPCRTMPEWGMSSWDRSNPSLPTSRTWPVLATMKWNSQSVCVCMRTCVCACVCVCVCWHACMCAWFPNFFHLLFYWFYFLVNKIFFEGVEFWVVKSWLFSFVKDWTYSLFQYVFTVLGF